MLKAYEEEILERHEVRVEYLEFRAAYHLKRVSEEKDMLLKINHMRMFAMYNALLIKEKYGEEWEL
jgi:hypothetical protein